MYIKFWQLFCITTVLSICVVANAFYARNAEFYTAIVYLTKSSLSLTVLYIQAFLTIWAAFKCCQKVFFGQLRAMEVEHVFEKSWYAVTESALAFTVFRDEFNYFFVGSFIFLLAVKCAHWIAEDRVDLMERSPSLPSIFHIRMVSVMFILTFIDAASVHYSLNIVLSRGPSVQLVFAFEYAVLYSVLFMVAAKYTLHSMDQRHRFNWDRKVVYLLYAELGTSFYRLVLYLAFVSLMLAMKIFALFAIRPTYMAVRSFTKALTDVIRSRIAIRNLNTLFPDATEQDLRALNDSICIICREEMLVPAASEPAPVCKKLECGHIFHVFCLRSWFQRQQTCPTCRADVVSMRNQRNNGTRPRSQQEPASTDATEQIRTFEIPVIPRPPPLPMFLLPPVAVPNLANLTVEQLKARELALIGEMEARMKCLESVRQCLDSSLGQLKRYVEMASTSSQQQEQQNSQIS